MRPGGAAEGAGGSAVHGSEQDDPRRALNSPRAEVRAEEPAPSSVADSAKAAKHRRKREARRARSGADAGAAPAPSGSGWVDRQTGVEFLAAELRAWAASGACEFFGAGQHLGAVREAEGRWRMIVLAFPEKWADAGLENASADASPSSTNRPQPAETLREWVASRGSAALAGWCSDIGLTSLVDLVRMDDRAWVAATAAATPPDDVAEGFGNARVILRQLMTGVADG